MDVREYLSRKGLNWIEKRRPSGNQAVMNCIFCDDKEKKFAVNLDNGAFQCLRQNNCGRKGSFYDLQRHFGDTPLPPNSSRSFITPKKIYKKPAVKSDPRSKELYDFFTARKITKDTLDKFKIGQKGEAIAIPHFCDGEIVFIKYRSISDKRFWNEKDSKPILYNMDACKDESILRIFEGQFDVMAASQYGIDGVSVPNGVSDLIWIDNCWDYIDGFKNIYLYFDNDTAGQDAVDFIVKRLGEWRCYNVLLPGKDMNECLIKGIGVDKIIEAEKCATEYTHDKLKKADYFRDQVIKLNQTREEKYGHEIGFKNVNRICRGWRDGELTIIHGHNGSGKSTIINQEILFQIGKGHKICMLSLELPPKRYLSWMCQQHVRAEYITDENINTAFNFFGDNLIIVNHVGEITRENLFDIFRFAARKYSIKFFVLDSMMRVKFDFRHELIDQKNFIDDCKNFAMEFNGHFFLIAHPRKGQSDNSKPNISDILGTSNIGNVCDNILAMWRSKEIDSEKCDSVFYIQKNREYGERGEVKMFFNSGHRIFVEV